MQLPRIALGCGNFGGVGSAPEFFGQGIDEPGALAIMDAAWGAGITHFDTADAYGGGRSEQAVGRWMAERGEELARLVAAQPGVAAVAAQGDVGAAFARAAEAPQPAWSLLFYALWHSHHLLGVPCEGDVAQVLTEAARAG